MRNLKYSFIVMLLILFSCTSQKTLQTQIPFEIGSASAQKYLGGKEKSGAGMIVYIGVTLPNEVDVTLNEVFFREKKAKVFIEEQNGVSFATARIPDSKKESLETADFKLESTEAVLSYTENGKLKYTKVTGIKQKQPLIHNSIRKN